MHETKNFLYLDTLSKTGDQHGIFSQPSNCHSVHVGCVCRSQPYTSMWLLHIYLFLINTVYAFYHSSFSKHAFLKVIHADSLLCDIVAHLFGTFAILTAYFW